MPVAPPRPKGPPLNALRAFEAAARLGGFKQAAAELCVTPGAVAQHVKFLENWCGGSLFDRLATGVQLTALGRSVLPEFVVAFDALSAATQVLRVNAAPNRVNIAALPSLAQLWLAPLLPQIRQVMPDISISVTAMESPPNMGREPFDLALFFETTPRDGATLQLGPDTLVPVCSPPYARQISDIRDLIRIPCLSDQMWPDDWRLWLDRASPDESVAVTGPSYSLYALALQEAQNGAGVLIGHRSLVQPALDSGALVVPFDQEVDVEQYLTMAARQDAPKDSASHAIVARLKQLLGNGRTRFNPSPQPPEKYTLRHR